MREHGWEGKTEDTPHGLVSAPPAELQEAAMETWSVDQVCSWLVEKSLGELVHRFEGEPLTLKKTRLMGPPRHSECSLLLNVAFTASCVCVCTRVRLCIWMWSPDRRKLPFLY